MPEDQERRSKRVHSAAMGYNEDKLYNKMMKLYDEKKMNFACQNALVVAEVKERKIVKRQAPKKQIERSPIVSNHITQRLKHFITNQKKGKDVKLLIQKSLFASDLEKNQNRLNLPINQLETLDFLTEEEKEDVEEGHGLEVMLLGPKLQMFEKPMVLKMWKLKSSKNYVLKTNWNSFVKKNEQDLKQNTVIQVWSFREHEKLRFAIACVEKDVDIRNDFSPLPLKKRLHFLYPGTFDSSKDSTIL